MLIYDIVTSDGYIITIFKIPSAFSKPGNLPFLLLTGLIDSSDTWVANSPELSIPFFLLSRGYTVYLGNVRGNHYGRRHVQYTVDDAEFWNYSFHEMAILDLPTIIKFVKKTEAVDKVNYLAHSQGTQVYLAGASDMPDFYNSSLNEIILLSPISKLDNIKSASLLWASLTNIDHLVLYSGYTNLLYRHKQISQISQYFCRDLGYICKYIIESEIDLDTKDINMSRLNFFFANFPSGTSVVNLSHFAQIIRKRRFVKYDHGPIRNLELYGQIEAPDYDLRNVPGEKVSIITGTADRLSTIEDNEVLAKLIKPKNFHKLEGYGHLSILLSKRKLVLNAIEKSLE